MSPDEMLKQAKKAPEKRGLDAYLDTILELRRKGHTYRQIAEFLNDRGVATDHTAVFRLIAAENPLSVYHDDELLLGDVVYESRKGRPLRPYDAGLSIAITKKLKIIRLKTTSATAAIWCEAQFELSEVPNYQWLRQLCKSLHIEWDPEHPCHLRARFGLELKFEGNLMAMVCRTFNLEQMMQDVGTGVKKATKFFADDKGRYSRWLKLLSDRNAELLEQVLINPGESKDEVCEELLEWIRGDDERLTKEFNSIRMP